VKGVTKAGNIPLNQSGFLDIGPPQSDNFCGLAY
jgi:hypothetical protein